MRFSHSSKYFQISNNKGNSQCICSNKSNLKTKNEQADERNLIITKRKVGS